MPLPAKEMSLAVPCPLLSCAASSGRGDALQLRLLVVLAPSRPGLLGAEWWMMHVPTLLCSSMLSRLVMLARRCPASLLT